MKARALWPLVGAGAPLVIAAPASAAFTGVLGIQRPNPYATATFDLYAQFDGGPGDFVFAVAGTPLHPLNVNVVGGIFYQNPFGTDLAPNPALFPFFPSVEYDTFVTIGKATSEGDATGLAPGWPGFRNDVILFNNSGWFISPDDPQGAPDADGRVLLARLSMNSFNGHGPLVFFGSVVVAGYSNGEAFQEPLSFELYGIPAPGAVPLLAAAGLAGARRRRRP